MTLREFVQPTLPVARLSISCSAEGTAAVLALCGEADLFTLPAVVDALARVIADNDGPIVVDLAETKFIDTGTARAFARASQFLGDRGRELTLRSPSRIAVQVLTLLGLSDLIEGTTSGPHHGVCMTRKKAAPWASS